MNRWGKLFLLFAVALTFHACADTSTGQSAQTQSMGSEQNTQTQTSFTLLHSPVEGSAKIGYAQNGMYYLQYLQDGTGNLQLLYLDYAAAQAHIVCASPECLHNSEACTGWFSGSYGPGSIMVIDNSVYIWFSGSNPKSGPTVFPQILKMDADGRNRKKLTTFAESSTLRGAFATDGTSLYVTEKAFERKGGLYETKTKLMKIDLATGTQSCLRAWAADVWITGAANGQLILLKPENFDTNGSGIYEGANGAAYTILGVDAQANETELYAVVENGFLGTVRGDSYYALDAQTSTVTRTRLFTGETVTLCTLPNALEKGKAFWGELIGNRLFLSGAFATRTTETDIKTLYGIDVDNGTCTEIYLAQEDPNLPDNDNPVCVIAQWGQDYIVTNRMQISQIAYVDNAGVNQVVDAMTMGYALIEQSDLLSSVANYRNVE